MKPVVAKNLVKVFVTKERKGLFRRGRTKRVVAVNRVSFEIGKGEIFGLLGPNGAGKTTTIKILATLLLPDDGDAWVNGFHVVEEAEKVRESIGVSLYSDRGFYWKLTGRENLMYFAYLYGFAPSRARERVEEVLRLVGLTEEADKLVEEYSTGMKAKLSLARALLNDAPVLLLDEPTIGLDPRSARSVRQLVLDLKREGKAILLTTHNMEEADQLCDRIAIIDRGRIVAQGTPSELKRLVSDHDVVEIEASRLPDAVVDKLRGIDGVVYVSSSQVDSGLKTLLRLGVERGRDDVVARAVSLVYGAGARIHYVKPVSPSLEDVFIKLTGRGFEDAEREAPA